MAINDIEQRLRQWANFPSLHNSHALIMEAADTIRDFRNALQRIADGDIPAARADKFADQVLKDKS